MSLISLSQQLRLIAKSHFLIVLALVFSHPGVTTKQVIHLWFVGVVVVVLGGFVVLAVVFVCFCSVFLVLQN